MSDLGDPASPVRIGVFDSGVGGIAVANAVKAALPDYEIIYRNDHKHVPYGSRPPQQLLKFVEPILRDMVQEGCVVIVIACNTVTTLLIDQLRLRISVPLIGIEPMVAEAAELTETGVIAVCATPATLASKRYHQLKETYAKTIRILEPECRDWAYMIEHDEVDDIKVQKRIESVISDGADVIVLACTHYHWIENKIRYLAVNKAQVIQPEQKTIALLKDQLTELGLGVTAEA